MNYSIQMGVHSGGSTTKLSHGINLPDDFSGDIGIAVRPEGGVTRMVESAKVAPPIKPTKPCIICGKRLGSIMDDWHSMQPSGGGEVRMSFDYGSAHDSREGGWITGVICDDCADGIIKVMEKK